MLWRPAAWVVCGPLGHLVAGAVDVAVFAARAARDRARVLVSRT